MGFLAAQSPRTEEIFEPYICHAINSLLTNIHDNSTIVKRRRSKSGVGDHEETVKPTATSTCLE